MRKLLLPAIGLLCSAQAGATTIVPLSTLPTDIQNCFQTGDCFDESGGGNMYSTLDTTGVVAFEYWQWSGSTYQHKWLMRYELLSPLGTVSGVAWLSAQNSYNIAASDAHSFTLYYPDFWSSTTATQTFRLNDNDLADGSAFVRAEDWGWRIDVSGDLDLGINPNDTLCLAEGCGAKWTLNLLYMNFVNGQFSFNAGDTREVLYEYRDWYCNPDDTSRDDCAYSDMAVVHSIALNPIPLPASALLFMSGLVGGALGVRRQRSKPKE